MSRLSESSERFRTETKLPWTTPHGLAAVLEQWQASRRVFGNVTLHERLPARPAQRVPIPDELTSSIRNALAARGVRELYSHQREACAHAMAGRDVVIATPTASGKSLCYNLPVLQALAQDPASRALYLFPTKALARDQEAALRELLREAGLQSGAITYDGDTPADARRAARERSAVLLTNPDMLHAGILPHHANWARFFAKLRYVVIDELHVYRGVFGSHLANVLRRLQRIARFHGSEPVFLLASATIGNPGEHASRLVGRPVQLIDESGAPQGPRRLIVYNPPVVNAELGVRESYVKAAVRLTSDLVLAGVTTLVFGQSRNNVEVMLKYLRERLARERVPPERVAGYRGGYLPELRRNIEHSLRDGELSCVVATNALELGIDIGALDAVVCAGYPGSVSGLWQRFGRGGRRGGESLALLVASSAPLDQYVAGQGGQLLSAIGIAPALRGGAGLAVEQARIDPDNAEILVQHVKCAAFELPFESGEGFGDVPQDVVGDALQFLGEHRVLHAVRGAQGKTTYHWASDAYPASHVSLRSVGFDNFAIIDVERAASEATAAVGWDPSGSADGAGRARALPVGKVIAEMDWRSTHTMLHEQAIYQHDSVQYQVERLDYENHKAFVRMVDSDYFTTALTNTKVSVIERAEEQPLAEPTRGSEATPAEEWGHDGSAGGAGRARALPVLRTATVGHGDVSVVEKVVGYKKIKYHTHENVGYGDVNLPEMQMHTTALWLTVPEAVVQRQDVQRPWVIDALRGIANALHTVACVGLMTDPGDLGRTLGDKSDPDGVPGKGGGGPGYDPTIFLYDHVPGGIGLAPRLFEARHELLRNARALLQACSCERGCPACVGPVIGEPGMAVDALPPRKRIAIALLVDLGVPGLH